MALRDVLARGARNAWRRTAWTCSAAGPSSAGDTTEEFWALKDVSFEVKRGEVLGIIGRNGAGKSTLLKILSRITEPTRRPRNDQGPRRELARGRHRLSPRAYGTGKHLSQRRHPRHEPRRDQRKFDEIVAFAEVEKFLDTPVKRYSSGMYVRLAFAVAAHLEPEILIVDEVSRRRRRRVPKEMAGQDGAKLPKGDGPCCSSATIWDPYESYVFMLFCSKAES